MRYWWVNQKQTYRHEVPGGYLWSPQRKRNGARNPFYESMREAAPGDLVFSFADGLIKAVGIVKSFCYPCPKPGEFGAAGMYWDMVGWRVDVAFQEQRLPIRPKDHIDVLRPLLPERYAPLQPSGDGLQSVYLTELSRSFAETLAGLVGRQVLDIVRGNYAAGGDSTRLEDAAYPEPVAQWEEELVRRVQADDRLTDTERTAVVLARRGQGLFKHRVLENEHACRVTRVDRLEHLRASHCKPWRESNNDERLDGDNGLLLTPTIDHLFDRGFISFENSGDLIVSPAAHGESLRKMGIDPGAHVKVGTFSHGQRQYLDYHRDHVFLARRASG